MKKNDKVDEKKLEKAIETTNFNNLKKKEKMVNLMKMQFH